MVRQKIDNTGGNFKQGDVGIKVMQDQFTTNLFRMVLAGTWTFLLLFVNNPVVWWFLFLWMMFVTTLHGIVCLSTIILQIAKEQV